MWIYDEWCLEVRRILEDEDISLVDNDYTLEDLFDQGLSPAEVLLYFM